MNIHLADLLFFFFFYYCPATYWAVPESTTFFSRRISHMMKGGFDIGKTRVSDKWIYWKERLQLAVVNVWI